MHGFMIYSWWWAKRYANAKMKRATVSDIWQATKAAAGPLGFVVLIIGGIYSGIFSPTEAAAVAVGYSFVVEAFVYRAIRVRDIGGIALRSGTTTALVFILVGGAEAFVWLLTVARVPHSLTQLILTFDPSPVFLLLIINATFFAALMFFNPISAMIVLTPLFMPIALKYGINPVHLGVLITLNAAIGSATPPFGVDIFTACAIFRLPYDSVVKGVPPFIIAGLGVLLILTFFPDLILILPRLLL